MPKNKKQESSSDSDEGPIDASPPRNKKAKTGRTDDVDPTWMLNGRKRVIVRKFKGRLFVDIREFFEKNGEQLPGKKGISLSPELWKKLLSLSDEINKAISEKS